MLLYLQHLHLLRQISSVIQAIRRIVILDYSNLRRSFQRVRDDQHLPPGLHVRLNIWSGLKEARLNIPMADDEEMQDLPTERAVVMVPQPDQEPLEENPALRDRLPQKPPVYEAAGKIPPPRDPDGSGDDSENFHRSVDVLGNLKTEKVDTHTESAFLILADLSHDIYYGVELMKRRDVLSRLLSMTMYKSPDAAVASQYRRQAASVLANSVQNNPTALKEALNTWNKLSEPLCGGKSCREHDLAQYIYQFLEMEFEPSAMKAKIYALHGMLKDEDLRLAFLKLRGMDLLLSIFTRLGEQWDTARVKIAQFVTDTFLDENMGAQLGVWPVHGVAEGARLCQRGTCS